MVVDIARAHILPADRAFRVCGRKPPNVHIYNHPKEPCWFVFARWDDGRDDGMLRSSHVILVSKISGKVLYSGSASDEG
jgi:hypothetical protein